MSNIIVFTECLQNTDVIARKFSRFSNIEFAQTKAIAILAILGQFGLILPRAKEALFAINCEPRAIRNISEHAIFEHVLRKEFVSKKMLEIWVADVRLVLESHVLWQDDQMQFVYTFISL